MAEIIVMDGRIDISESNAGMNIAALSAYFNEAIAFRKKITPSVKKN
jgi:hypothetical protein